MPVSNETLTLTDFLLARIADDEAATRRPTFLSVHGTHMAYRQRAECEAKRRIVKSFAAGEPYQRGTDSYAITGMVLRLLSLPYADHPDYRDEWRP